MKRVGTLDILFSQIDKFDIVSQRPHVTNLL